MSASNSKSITVSGCFVAKGAPDSGVHKFLQNSQYHHCNTSRRAVVVKGLRSQETMPRLEVSPAELRQQQQAVLAYECKVNEWANARCWRNRSRTASAKQKIILRTF